MNQSFENRLGISSGGLPARQSTPALVSFLNDHIAREFNAVDRLTKVLLGNGIVDLLVETVAQPIRTTASFLIGIGESQATSSLRLIAKEDESDYRNALESFKSAIVSAYGIDGVVDYEYTLTLVSGAKR